MIKSNALFVSLKTVKQDPALQPGGRGDRKVLVTELYPQTEEEATEVVWRAGSLKCPVQLMSDTECAVFSHQAHQDRHFHKQSTEIYMLLEGKMNIEVEGEAFELAAGDMIVVNPGACHEVRPAGTEFLCRVITVNCGGKSDKVIE